MKRREFVAGLVGTVASPAFAPAALAQSTTKRVLLGYLSGTTQTEATPFIGLFLGGLREEGYVEGRDFDIAYRFADGHYDRLKLLAQQLVDLSPDVIITPTSDIAALAIRAATQQIPIVSPTLGDPVQSGLVASFNRPGGNVTGSTTIVEHLPQKQLELAVQALPGKMRFGVLVNVSAGEPSLSQQREIEAASATLGVDVIWAAVRAPDDLDAAFRALTEQRAEAVIVLQDGMLVTQRRRIVALASKAHLPDIHSVRDAVIAGGFLCYGINLRENFRRAAALVVKILNGSSPANLPVEFPTKLDLVINLKTASALGLTIPPLVLARADEVIE
jgi:putative tryptophan/tyrosine transport system substrate-binding protein